MWLIDLDFVAYAVLVPPGGGLSQAVGCHMVGEKDLGAGHMQSLPVVGRFRPEIVG